MGDVPLKLFFESKKDEYETQDKNAVQRGDRMNSQKMFDQETR